MGKGGESDDVDKVGLVRLLFDLFRGRLLLQFLFVHLRGIAFRTAAPAAFSRARAFSGGTRTGRSRSSGRPRTSDSRIRAGARAYDAHDRRAAIFPRQRFAVQL